MRKKRLIIDNGLYHVIARANRQEFIFEQNEFKELFIDIIRAAKKKYDFLIYHFCIMDNHIHFIIKPLKKSKLSEIMRWILGNFAVKFNRLNNYHGHVWYDRFKSIIIRTYTQFLRVFDYISNNPVKAGIVQKAEDYFYSGITFIKNKVFEIVNPPGPYFRY